MTSILDPNLAAVTGPSPAGSGLPQPPVFDSVDAERKYRKEQLAAGFRLFGKFGFSEGVAGHITVRDPEHPRISGSIHSGWHSLKSKRPILSWSITKAM